MVSILRALQVVIVCLVVGASSATAQESITLAFYGHPDEAPVYRWGELIYTEAFKRLGIKFAYQVLPPIRASLMANSGVVDGEIARIDSYGTDHPNLIRVEESVATEKILAIVKDPSHVIENWESLRGTTYKVEFFRGIAKTRQHLKGLVNPALLSESSNPLYSLNKLYYGRIDVFIGSELRLLPLLETPAVKQFDLHVAGALDEVKVYPYLHKRHTSLAVKLEQVLRQMKSEGLFRKYYLETHKTKNTTK